jgi:hypothetical protein
MPYVNKPRPYKKEYQQQKARGEQPSRNARAKARYAYDKTHPDSPNDKDHTAESREGKDLEHIKPLSKGGSNSKKNIRVESQHANRSFVRNSDHTVKINKSRPAKKKNGNSR